MSAKLQSLAKSSIWGNLLTLTLALSQNWNLGEMAIVFWLQTLTVGLIYTFYILLTKKYSTKGVHLKSEDIGFKPTENRIRVGLFKVMLFYNLFIGLLTAMFIFAITLNIFKINIYNLIISFVIWIVEFALFFHYKLKNNSKKTTLISSIAGDNIFRFSIIQLSILAIAFGFIIFKIPNLSFALIIFTIIKIIIDIILDRIQKAWFWEDLDEKTKKLYT